VSGRALDDGVVAATVGDSSLDAVATQTRPLVSDAHLERAVKLVTRYGLRQLSDEWIADYRRARGKRGGGRPPVLHPATVLTLFLVLQMEGRPLHFTQLASLLYSGLTQQQQATLNVHVDPLVSHEQWYERARRAWAALGEAVDPFPRAGRHRAPTKAGYDAATARLDQDGHAHVRGERLDMLANLLIQASLEELPQRYRPDTYAVAFDATAVKDFQRGVSKARKASLGPDDHLSVEPEAGFYARSREDHSDDPKLPLDRVMWAYELDLLVGMHSDPDKMNQTPIVVLGIAVHRPGAALGRNARKVLENVLARGYRIDEYVADRAYLPGAKVEELQGFLFDHGIRAVCDYKVNQFGIQAQHAGMIMVDGRWYSPSMPQELIDLGKTYAEARKRDDSRVRRGEKPCKPDFTDRFEARVKYEFRPKERPNAAGNTPMMCPAVGPGATVWCPLKNFVEQAAKFPILTPPSNPGKACTNKYSISVPRDADGGMALKYGQAYAYGTAEWKRRYARRNVVESFNSYIKGGKNIGLDVPGRRRMRGASNKSLLFAIGVAVANLNKIDDFLAERGIEGIASAAGGNPASRSTRNGRSTQQQQFEHRRRVAHHLAQKRDSAA